MIENFIDDAITALRSGTSDDVKRSSAPVAAIRLNKSPTGSTAIGTIVSGEV
jgi:hypothetical protein